VSLIRSSKRTRREQKIINEAFHQSYIQAWSYEVALEPITRLSRSGGSPENFHQGQLKVRGNLGCFRGCRAQTVVIAKAEQRLRFWNCVI
jgi:hypothetical protein